LKERGEEEGHGHLSVITNLRRRGEEEGHIHLSVITNLERRRRRRRSRGRSRPPLSDHQFWKKEVNREVTATSQ